MQPRDPTVRSLLLFAAIGIAALRDGSNSVLRAQAGAVPWQAASSMTTGRVNFPAVVAGQYVYAFGGMNAASIHVATVERALINADGSLGMWTPTGSMTKTRVLAGAAAVGSYVYVLGGELSGGGSCNTPEACFTSTVERGTIGGDGSISAWQAMSPMTRERNSLAVLATGGFLYALGGGGTVYSSGVLTSQPNLDSVERAAINGDGSLGAWQVVSTMPTARFRAAAIVSNGYIYVLGGRGSSDEYLSRVDKAAVNPDGSLGSWQTVASLSETKEGLGAVVSNGSLLVLGGYMLPSSAYVRTVERASIASDGSLSPWTQAPAMISPRGYFGAVVSNDNVYAIGGGDGSGFTSSTERASTTFLFDSTAPTGTVTINSGAAYVTRTVVSLTPSASDAESGVAQMSFSNNGTTWSPYETYATTKTWTLPPGDGTQTVFARYKDGAGNVSSAVFATVVLDTTAPASSVIPMGSFQATTTFSVNWSATDAGSGVAQYDVQVRDGSSGPWSDLVTGTTATSATFGGLEGHTYGFRARARDVAGNQSTYGAADTQSTVDTVAPTVASLTINGGATTTTSRTVTVLVSAVDATSGVGDVSFSPDGSAWGPWQTFAASFGVVLPTGDGVKTLFGRCRDAAGNISSLVSHSITLDTTAPSDYTVSINLGALFTNTTAVSLLIGARPGTAEMQISNDGGFAGANWEPYTSRKTWTITQFGADVIPRVVYARFRDTSAAASTTAQDDIILDVMAPSGSVLIAGAQRPEDAAVAQVSLVLNANDDLSGVAEMAISNGPTFANVNWEPYRTTKTWTLNSEGSVHVKFKDAAGNSSTAVTPSGPAPSTGPFGSFDTPSDGTTGVTGSIAVTGWAMDDVDVTGVRILRDPVPGEAAGGLVFIGNAVLVEGARPDVQAIFPTSPNNTRAGWGYLMLTNFLPNLGNGTFRLTAIADDVDGHATVLGTKTITCSNSTATAPTGAIDTPPQGATVSGNVTNFGWVLSPSPRRADPPSGGTVRVVIDGTFSSAVPSGWTGRTDLTALFPATQFPGVANALGVAVFDSTALANGVHTISWLVTDNLGSASGIGSRYFTVSNGSQALDPSQGSVTGARSPVALPAVAARASHGVAAIQGRRGFSLDAPLRTYDVGGGRTTVQAEELDRIELQLGEVPDQRYVGYLRVADGVAPLPIGSVLDASTGAFTWAPGVGFVGTYDLVFVRRSGGQEIARQEVRIVLNPHGSSRVGPQTVIETPLSAQGTAVVGSSFVLAGWAADLDSTSDRGVDAVHVWAYPATREDPIWIGEANYGSVRADVAEIYGARFTNTGYGITVQGLRPGTYDLAVFAFSTIRGGFAPAKTLRVTVR